MSETQRGKKTWEMAWQKKNALWWLSIDRYGRQPIAFPCFYPTFHADIALAVTSGPISSQQCDRSTNYNWKWEDKREANRDIWKAIGEEVRVLHRQCWQCQSVVIFSMDEQWAGHQTNALNLTNPHITLLHRFRTRTLSRPINIF